MSLRPLFDLGWENLKDRNVIVDLGFVLLSYALSDPNYVPALLFLELYESVEDTIVKLLHKSVHIKLCFILKKFIFQRFFIARSSIKNTLVVGVVACNSTNLIVIVGPSKSS